MFCALSGLSAEWALWCAYDARFAWLARTVLAMMGDASTPFSFIHGTAPVAVSGCVSYDSRGSYRTKQMLHPS